MRTKRVIGLLVVFLFCASTSFASQAEVIDVERLADAIYKAEGGVKASKPYGILKSYCKKGDPDGRCRKGCIQTITKWKKRLTYDSPQDFIEQFSRIYAPLNAKNDPKKLNANWLKNVSFFYFGGRVEFYERS